MSTLFLVIACLACGLLIRDYRTKPFLLGRSLAFLLGCGLLFALVGSGFALACSGTPFAGALLGFESGIAAGAVFLHILLNTKSGPM